ncbi:hypothetical protein JCM33774_67200 [Actinophytocola sp. KF-1]
MQVAGERRERVRLLGERRRRGGGRLGEDVERDLAEQYRPVWKMAVERCDADARTARDHFQWHRRSLLNHEVNGGAKDLLAVAEGIRTRAARLRDVVH